MGKKKWLPPTVIEDIRMSQVDALACNGGMTPSPSLCNGGGTTGDSACHGGSWATMGCGNGTSASGDAVNCVSGDTPSV